MNSGAVGNFFAAKVAYAVTPSVSSQAANYPSTNVTSWAKPQRYWKANVNTPDQWVVLDAGAAIASVGGYILGANFTTATLQANAADSWGAPAVSVPIALSLDQVTNRRQGAFFFNANRTTVSYRYYRLLIPQGQVTDDGGMYRVWCFFPLVSAVEFEARGSWTLGRRKVVWRNPLPQGEEEVFSAGRRKIFLRGTPQFFLNPYQGAAENEEAIMLGLSADEDEPLVICRNLYRPEQSYLCRRRGDVEWQSEENVGAGFPLEYEEI